VIPGERIRQRLVGCLVRTYPADWRGRYQDEFLAVLEKTPITWRVLGDLVLGAFDARLRAIQVRGPRDWLTLAASAWTVLAAIAFWFYPTGGACTTAPGGAELCHTTSIASALPWDQTTLIVAASVAFGCVPFWFRSSRGWLVTWFLLILFGYVATFGATLWILPAALAVGVAAMLPRQAVRR
jgi:hypothetical protein